MDLSQLSQALRDDISYPRQMAFVETGIRGRGFFPGSRGYVEGWSPVGGVMLLGRDFGTLSYYEELAGAAADRDEYALTWRHTRDVYLSSTEQPSLYDLPVWCTNYLMGVRADGSAKGNVKDQIEVVDWVRYEESCWRFFQRQVLLQKPRVIAIFGEFNRLDLLAEGRFGKGRGETFQHLFRSDGACHSAVLTFADHPHSLIRNVAKDAARERDVRRIRELYASTAK